MASVRQCFGLGIVATFVGGAGALVFACSAAEPAALSGGSDGGSKARDGSVVQPARDSGPTALTASAAIGSTLVDGGASGSATFVEQGGQITVTLQVTSAPDGNHGVHVHQVGDCGDGGLNAGGHFNPGDAGHGLPTSAGQHAGDFGNLSVSGGVGQLTINTTRLTVADGPTSVVGRALMVHANPDDGTAGVDGGGPGNSGKRIGCGVITRQ